MHSAKSASKDWSSWLRRRLSDAGLTHHAILTMVKSAIPATILLAAYQSRTWSAHFNVLDYLMAIEGLLAFCILPRARFLQVLTLNVFMICLATAINSLALWSAVQARRHTAKPGDGEYNSSCSAVCAIWFAVQIYLTNALRSSRPQFQFPCINYSIFTIIALVQAGPSFITSQTAVDFLWLEMQAFLTGFAVAAVVSLIILPHSNREIAIHSTQSYIGVIKQVLDACESLIDNDSNPDTITALKAKISALEAAHAKLGSELDFATRDFGFSHLSARDLTQLYQHLRQILLPTLTFGAIADLHTGVPHAEACSCQTSECKRNSETFEATSHQAVMGMKTSLDLIAQSLSQPAAKNKETDLEKNGPNSRTAEIHAEVISQMNAIILDASPHDEHNSESRMDNEGQCSLHHWHTVIKQHTLLHKCEAILSMLVYVKDRTECGAWDNRKLIYPTWSTLIRWTKAAFATSGSTRDSVADHFTNDAHREALKALLLGRNPQHLPPTNLVGRVGDILRAVPRFMKSRHSYFGFRAMCASMSLGIIAFLHPSYQFFKEQRCLWAVVMTGIALNNSTGQSAFTFMLRILASIAGTVGSLVCWYIVDGHPAGVICFCFVYMAGSFYWCVVKPKYTLLAIVSAVTPIIQLGYALNGDVLPQEVLHETDTPDYQLWRIALYRLVYVIIGLAVEYFWSIFPFPITESFVMRQEIGSCAYLLAKYNAIMTETILADKPSQTASELQGARVEVLTQAQHHVSLLKMSSSYSTWQLGIGGKTPILDYREAIELLEALLTNMVIMSYASSKSRSPQLRDLADMARKVTATLCVVAAAITSGNALPPDFTLATTQQLEKDDSKTVHSFEAAPAVAGMATNNLRTHTVQLRQAMKRICGELDLSLATLSTAGISVAGATATSSISQA